MKICVIGLGQIGLPVAKYAHSKGHEVWGFDINPNAIKKLSKTSKFKVTNKFCEIPQAEVYIICVSTQLVNNEPDVSAVFEVCNEISKIANKSTLVSIESTIYPTISRRIFEDIFNCNINLVHVPHRFWADEPEKHGVNQLRVIGAVNSKSMAVGLNFYEKILGIPMHKCATIEIAEMSKIIENSHRYLQIAFAEELKLMCSSIDMDFDELQTACNTKWNVDISHAKEGIGRHCLPKDIRYVTFTSPSTMLENAIDIDKKYRKWLTEQQ